MYKKSDTEMELAILIKAYRNFIRFKHSVLADKEINETLPDVIADFNKRLQQGSLTSVDFESIDIENWETYVTYDKQTS